MALRERVVVVELDEADDLIHRGTLSMNGGVVEAEYVTDFIKKFGLTSRRVRHIRLPSWCCESDDNRHGAKLLKNSTNITLSGRNGQLITVDQWVGSEEET